jgi:uncharacterized protein (TIGR03083 family)
MDKAQIWSTIQQERAALADDLRGLSDEQWDVASLCEGWSVRDVVAHMTASAKITVPSFFMKLISSGFSFDKLQRKDIAVERGDSPADALDRFREQITSTSHPPGPTDSWLGEAMIHGEDIRRPLGIAHEYPTDATARVADFYKGSNLIVGAKKRIEGLHLQATDSDFSTGEGPEVKGPTIALVMAMTGRKVVMADLAGDGVATLESR